MDRWYVDNVVCPLDLGSLSLSSERLVCAHGHSYPIVDGIPVLLVEGIEQTLHVAERSLEQAHSSKPSDGWYLDSVGVSPSERREIEALIRDPKSPIDPVVSYLVGATNGIAYKHLMGAMGTYPIPELRLADGQGKTFLDVGCNWGRWSIAAARKGYRPIGIDPSLGAVMAARRVARSLGLDIHFLVGDARNLPLRGGCVDTVFSYSVIQHFDRRDAAKTVAEIGRVLVPGGLSLVQMPTRYGIRCLYHQWRRGFREGNGFDVRYYRPKVLKELFGAAVGKSRLSVDCFFGIGLQRSDWDLMSPAVKIAITVSEWLRGASRFFSFLVYFADSVYVASRKPSAPSP